MAKRYNAVYFCIRQTIGPNTCHSWKINYGNIYNRPVSYYRTGSSRAVKKIQASVTGKKKLLSGRNQQKILHNCRIFSAHGKA
jgi:hypothetical protein